MRAFSWRALEAVVRDRAGVAGLVFAAGIGIRSALKRDEICKELQWNGQHERRKPFFDCGDFDGVLGRRCGDSLASYM